MLVLNKKVTELTIPEMARVIDELVESGYVAEFAPSVKQPNEMVDCVLEIVDYSDSDVIAGAKERNVVATPLGTKCPNGFDEWSFEGIDSNMRKWYNEWYTGGSPEIHNGYNFDVLQINE